MDLHFMLSWSPPRTCKPQAACIAGTCPPCKGTCTNKLQQAGWKVAVRLDPLIWYAEFEQGYGNLIQRMVEQLNCEALHSVSLGSFRLPDGFFKILAKLYPGHWLFASGVQAREGQHGYTEQVTKLLLDYCEEKVKQSMPSTKIYRHQ